MRITGVDLAQSTAHHHQSAGVAERFNGTLINMCRAANQGGSHWCDHLPFLLFAYRATPHRVTRHSPAFLLYGRELRLPSQLENPIPTGPVADADTAEAIDSYAGRLMQQLLGAWAAARELSVDQQLADRDLDTSDVTPVVYAENDRVCRELPDHVNKLQWKWSGPYRISEVLPDGNYRLRDLENCLLHDVFPSIKLRPYYTTVDAETLQPDEFIVDELLRRRGSSPNREYLAKWRHHPRSAATWVNETELRRRCTTLIDEYDLANPEPTPNIPPHSTPAPAPTRGHVDSSGSPSASKIMLIDPDTDDIYAWRRRDHGDTGYQLDLPGGSRDMSDISAAAALLREVREEIHTTPALDRRCRHCLSHTS